jgi:hypothetical protein
MFKAATITFVIASGAKQSIARRRRIEKWIASSLTLLAMTWIDFPIRTSNSRDRIAVAGSQTHVRNPAARNARAMHDPFPPRIEGAGNAGRSMRPQPRMQNKKAYECSHHGHTGFVRHSPRNGFTVSCVLFPVTGFVATVIGGSLRQLDASIGASEPHTFAVREAGAFVFHATSRPSHPVPNVRDDRETPLCGTG